MQGTHIVHLLLHSILKLVQLSCSHFQRHAWGESSSTNLQRQATRKSGGSTTQKLPPPEISIHVVPRVSALLCV